ncbi:aminoglycoside phosphotransferase family protein [Neobacillus drentensis]|uniref:aminoglycoside phosphotransferase family protein n=1 Tax=Neobacillus drentensis TaxID=220684 RepID=UPI003000463F
MIEEIVKKHLREYYGDFTLVRLTGGYTNETFLLKGIQSSLVVKVANTNNKHIENEISSLKIMQETEVVPRVYDLIETNHLKLVVMEYRQGLHGQSIIEKHDFETAKTLYKSLGETLANSIHINIFPNTSKGIRESTVNVMNLNLDFVPEILISKSRDILQNINESKKDWVLTHGDYGVHNVLFSAESGLTVLDWEWSEWAHPLTDIIWVCWFTKLHYPEQADLLNQLFLEEYKKFNQVKLSPEKVKAYSLYKVWKVLHKVEQAPQAVQEEWIRRLKWTIDTELISSSMYY